MDGGARAPLAYKGGSALHTSPGPGQEGGQQVGLALTATLGLQT